MIEETRRPNPRSRGERTRRRNRVLNLGKDYVPAISPLSISPTNIMVQLENHKNNNMLSSRLWPFEPTPQISKSLSLPPEKKKLRKSITRFLSFRNKDKKKQKSGESEVSGLQENKISVDASRETICEEVCSTPDPGVSLRNEILRASSVIELADNAKKSDPSIGEDDSTDSFKSVGSPVLRNKRLDPIVDSTIRGGEGDALTSTQSAFSNFAESEYLEQLNRRKPKKSVWQKLFRKDSVSSSDSVHGRNMSEHQGAIRKEKARGRGSAANRKSTASEEEVKKNTAIPDEEDLKKSEVGGLNPKKEEAKKVSGDDLRKQLSEGLKNGAGRPKEAAVVETVSTKKESKDTKEEVPEKRKNSPEGGTSDNGESKEDPQPSTSQEGSGEPAKDPADMPPPDGKREHLYKVLVIGELGTGKTSIIKRYVHQFFSQHYRATIGVDFALKVLNWDDNTIIRLQLWDIAGQERFGNMTRVYYKEAVGAFIVFDVTRAATFDAVLKWKQDLDSKVQLSDGSNLPCILLANKCDQPKEGLVNNKSKMDEFCREKGFAGWFETSAKENINIEEAAKSLVLKILQNDKLVRNGDRGEDGSKIALDGREDATPSKSCSC